MTDEEAAFKRWVTNCKQGFTYLDVFEAGCAWQASKDADTWWKLREEAKELTETTLQQARLLGISGEKELKLLARIERLEKALEKVVTVAGTGLSPEYRRSDLMFKIAREALGGK